MTSLDGINGWLIQMLLRRENDLKQSDEIQAKVLFVLHHFFSTNHHTSLAITVSSFRISFEDEVNIKSETFNH